MQGEFGFFLIFLNFLLGGGDGEIFVVGMGVAMRTGEGVLRWQEAGGRDLVMTGGRNLASQIPKFCTLVGNVIATTP